MTEGVKILLTISHEINEKIEALVKDINNKKAGFFRPTNRQAIIRGLLDYALAQDIQIKFHYRRDVLVRDK